MMSVCKEKEMKNDTIICPGCGWIGDVDQLRAGKYPNEVFCPDCGYENNAPPHYRLLTIGEMLYDDEEYNNVRMDLFLQSLSRVITGMHLGE